MIGGGAQPRLRPRARAGHDRRDVAAERQPAAAVIAAAFIPGQEQQPARPERSQQRRQQSGEEAVSGGGIAVVHVVAQVGRDPDQPRQRVRPLVGGQLRQRDDPRTAARVTRDARVVGERIVLLGVLAGSGTGEARPRKVLYVGLPGDLGALQLIDNAGGGDVAARAVAVDPECGAAGQGEVVGQRRVGDGEHRARQPVAARERIDVGRRARADDVAVLLVLHHHDGDVRRRSAADARRRRRRPLDRAASHGARAAAGDQRRRQQGRGDPKDSRRN